MRQLFELSSFLCDFLHLIGIWCSLKEPCPNHKDLFHYKAMCQLYFGIVIIFEEHHFNENIYNSSDLAVTRVYVFWMARKYYLGWSYIKAVMSQNYFKFSKVMIHNILFSLVFKIINVERKCTLQCASGVYG